MAGLITGTGIGFDKSASKPPSRMRAPGRPSSQRRTGARVHRVITLLTAVVFSLYGFGQIILPP
jgi:hypothetical protein